MISYGYGEISVPKVRPVLVLRPFFEALVLVLAKAVLVLVLTLDGLKTKKIFLDLL